MRYGDARCLQENTNVRSPEHISSGPPILDDRVEQSSQHRNGAINAYTTSGYRSFRTPSTSSLYRGSVETGSTKVATSHSPKLNGGISHSGGSENIGSPESHLGNVGMETRGDYLLDKSRLSGRTSFHGGGKGEPSHTLYTPEGGSGNGILVTGAGATVGEGRALDVYWGGLEVSSTRAQQSNSVRHHTLLRPTELDDDDVDVYDLDGPRGGGSSFHRHRHRRGKRSDGVGSSRGFSVANGVTTEGTVYPPPSTLPGESSTYSDTGSSYAYGKRPEMDTPTPGLGVGYGLDSQQTRSFQLYLKNSPIRKYAVQLKMLEMIQFWMALPGTKSSIDAAINDVMQKSGLSVVRVFQAWGSTSSPLRKEDNTATETNLPGLPASCVTESGDNKDVNTFGLDYTVQKTPPPLNEASCSSTRGGGKDCSSSTTDSSAASNPAFLPTAVSPHAPRKPKDLTHIRVSPRAFRRPDQTDGACEQQHPGTDHPDPIIRGPLEAKPDVKYSQEPDVTEKPSLATCNPLGDGESISTTAKPCTPSIERKVSGVDGVPPNGRLSHSSGASYEAIPQFFFPLGKPVIGEKVISGPLSKYENPHLKIANDMQLPVAMYDGGESPNSSMTESLKSSAGPARQESMLPSMSTLRCASDRLVHTFIQKEFARLPAPPKLHQKVRLVSSRLRGFGSGNSSSSIVKQEALYRQHLLHCIQRICTQCFGVPRYFAYVILRIMQSENKYPAIQSTATGGHRGVPGSSLTGNVSQWNQILFITSQHVKDFYNAHLRGKDILRRTFDLLVMSSRVSRRGSGTLPSMDPATQRSHLLPEDFSMYIDVLLCHHPGLAFLRQTPDFQSKYLDTVTYRIFYEVDRLDRGRISFAEFSTSRLMDAFRQVDASDDINAVLLFFSYEHFYVLYCRFWELDEDRDMMLSPEDLMAYAPESVMNPLIVQRVFAGVGRRLRCTVRNRINYEDFVWFCLSEEDKSTPPAICYWFRILDLDGDGMLSVYELRAFYEVTKDKISQFVADEGVAFDDVICQVFDMLRHSGNRGLRVAELLKEPEAAYVALNMLTNVVRFLQFEQRDPFVAHQERLLGGPEQNAWDRFARIEYDRMSQEADE